MAEWHIDSERDYDEWSWFGENSTVNAAAPLPDFPGGIGFHCKTIPPGLAPSFHQDRLDVVKVRELEGSG